MVEQTLYGVGSGETYATGGTLQEARRRSRKRYGRSGRADDYRPVETQVDITARKDGVKDPRESTRITAEAKGISFQEQRRQEKERLQQLYDPSFRHEKYPGLQGTLVKKREGGTEYDRGSWGKAIGGAKEVGTEVIYPGQFGRREGDYYVPPKDPWWYSESREKTAVKIERWAEEKTKLPPHIYGGKAVAEKDLGKEMRMRGTYGEWTYDRPRWTVTSTVTEAVRKPHIATVTYGIGFVGGGVTAVAAGAPKAVRWGATAAGIGAGGAYVGYKGYQVYKAETPKEQSRIIGGAISTEFVPAAVGAGAGYRFGTKAIAAWRTRGMTGIDPVHLTPKEVLAGEKKFIESPQKYHLSEFKESRYGYPFDYPGKVMYHAAPTSLPKYAQVAAGTSELPGWYGATGVSKHFLKIGAYSYKPTLTIKEGGRPTAYAVIVGKGMGGQSRFKPLPGKTLKEQKEWLTKYGEEARPYVPAKKTETEAIIKEGTIIETKPSGYYTVYDDVPVPIMRTTVSKRITAGKAGKAPTMETFTPGSSKYGGGYSVVSPSTLGLSYVGSSLYPSYSKTSFRSTSMKPYSPSRTTGVSSPTKPSYSYTPSGSFYSYGSSGSYRSSYRSPSYSYGYTPSYTPPYTPPPSKILPGGAGFGRYKEKRYRGKQPKKYTPTAFALLTGRKGKPKKKKKLTGLELRPVNIKL